MSILIYFFLKMVDSEHIPLPAETTISGRIINADTGEGIEGAQIPLTNSEGVDSVVANTDAQGNFNGAVAAGVYTLSKIIVNGTAIIITEMNITITAGQDNNIGVVGVSRDLTF